MTTVNDLVELLVQALRNRPRRVEHVKRFQEVVWSGEDLQVEPEVAQLLRDLAYDLDLYEPDERVRAEDPALYGEARLEEEIRSVLQRIAPGTIKTLR